MHEVDGEGALLRKLAEGTAAASGDEFFQSLVKHLAGALGVRSAFVAEFANSSTRVRTLAFWSGGRLLDNVEYGLVGTPCEEVVRGNICHHADNVAHEFPDDKTLEELRAVSYLGIPLCDEGGAALGHLAVMDDRPMPEQPRNLAVFRIFATRVRTEMLRLRAEQQLEQANQRLEEQVILRTKELTEALAQEEKPGAVHLELPEDIASEETNEPLINASLVRRPTAEAKSIAAAITRIQQANSPLLVVGAGANRKLTCRTLRQFVDDFGIPFVTTQAIV